jgi:hypothetical protein
MTRLSMPRHGKRPPQRPGTPDERSQDGQRIFRCQGETWQEIAWEDIKPGEKLLALSLHDRRLELELWRVEKVEGPIACPRPSPRERRALMRDDVIRLWPGSVAEFRQKMGDGRHWCFLAFDDGALLQLEVLLHDLRARTQHFHLAALELPAGELWAGKPTALLLSKGAVAPAHVRHALRKGFELTVRDGSDTFLLGADDNDLSRLRQLGLKQL